MKVLLITVLFISIFWQFQGKIRERRFRKASSHGIENADIIEIRYLDGEDIKRKEFKKEEYNALKNNANPDFSSLLPNLPECLDEELKKIFLENLKQVKPEFQKFVESIKYLFFGSFDENCLFMKFEGNGIKSNVIVPLKGGEREEEFYYERIIQEEQKTPKPCDPINCGKCTKISKLKEEIKIIEEEIYNIKITSEPKIEKKPVDCEKCKTIIDLRLEIEQYRKEFEKKKQEKEEKEKKEKSNEVVVKCPKCCCDPENPCKTGEEKYPAFTEQTNLYLYLLEGNEVLKKYPVYKFNYEKGFIKFALDENLGDKVDFIESIPDETDKNADYFSYRVKGADKRDVNVLGPNGGFILKSTNKKKKVNAEFVVDPKDNESIDKYFEDILKGWLGKSYKSKLEEFYV